MQLTKKQLDKLEKQVEQLYYKHAQGRQIEVMKIGAFFKETVALHLAGGDLEASVIAMVAKYTEPGVK